MFACFVGWTTRGLSLKALLPIHQHYITAFRRMHAIYMWCNKLPSIIAFIMPAMRSQAMELRVVLEQWSAIATDVYHEVNMSFCFAISFRRRKLSLLWICCRHCDLQSCRHCLLQIICRHCVLQGHDLWNVTGRRSSSKPRPWFIQKYFQGDSVLDDLR